MNCKTLLEVYNQLEMQHTFIVSAENEIIISAAEFKRTLRRFYITCKPLALNQAMSCFFRLMMKLDLLKHFGHVF